MFGSRRRGNTGFDSRNADRETAAAGMAFCIDATVATAAATTIAAGADATGYG